MSPHELNHEPDAPKLRQALRECRSPVIFVPPQIDDAILAQARQHLATIRPETGSWWRPGRLALAAGLAVIGTAAGILVLASRERTPADTADLNRDRRIDILDAFALARQLESGHATLDVNGDGTVDRQDIEALAGRAVALPKGGAS